MIKHEMFDLERPSEHARSSERRVFPQACDLMLCSNPLVDVGMYGQPPISHSRAPGRETSAKAYGWPTMSINGAQRFCEGCRNPCREVRGLPFVWWESPPLESEFARAEPPRSPDSSRIGEHGGAAKVPPPRAMPRDSRSRRRGQGLREHLLLHADLSARCQDLLGHCLTLSWQDVAIQHLSHPPSLTCMLGGITRDVSACAHFLCLP